MNIHLRFETSNIRFRNFLYSTGRLADLTWKYLDQICDDWCWSETMRDNDTANEEESQPAWPARGHSQLTPATWLAAATIEVEEKICKILSKLPWAGGCLPGGCQVFTNPRWTKYHHWQGHNRAVTGCRIMGSEGLVRTSGNYNALIGFSIEQSTGHQPSKTQRLGVKEGCLKLLCNTIMWSNIPDKF